MILVNKIVQASGAQSHRTSLSTQVSLLPSPCITPVLSSTRLPTSSLAIPTLWSVSMKKFETLCFHLGSNLKKYVNYTHMCLCVCVWNEKQAWPGGSGWPPKEEPLPSGFWTRAFPVGGARQSRATDRRTEWAAHAKNYFPHGKASWWHLTNMTNQPLAAVHRDKENGRHSFSAGNDINTSSRAFTVRQAVL